MLLRFGMIIEYYLVPMKFRYLKHKRRFMFKKIIPIAIICLFSLPSFAQVVGGKHNKLFNMFILEKYEDVYYKAFKMSEKEKHSREAEVYLYMTMALHKIAENPDLEEQYPDAYEDILKFGGKFRKYADKAMEKEEETVTPADNYDYLQELKAYVLNETYFIFVERKYSKAASRYRKVMKIFPDDENILFVAGISEMMSNNRQGQMKLDEFKTIVDEKYQNSSYEGDEVSNEYFGKTMKTWTNYLVTEGQADEAKTWMKLAYKMLPENADIEEQYEKIMN